MNKILLFNPRSARWKHSIPNSILQVGASVYGREDFVFVDGNLEADLWSTIDNYLQSGEFSFFGCTVMPGPQLKQAIPITLKIKEKYPDITTVWGGYFASNQADVCLKSGAVDYIVNGPGDEAFPQLIEALKEGNKEDIEKIKNLIFIKNGEKITTAKATLIDQDQLPLLPYDYLNSFYPIRKYLNNTFLGKRTIAYHSSFGCPFTCSFCAVVPIYNARWKGKSAKLIYKDVQFLKRQYDIDAIEFHDNNFFTSRKRTMEFAELVKNDGINWWGEGRIDTLNKYSDEELALMRQAGCRMIFFGAETGNDDVLKQMDKGGTQSAAQILSFAERLRKFDIIPEYSFVLGMPAATTEKAMQQIDEDIAFIKKVKEVNPSTEIIIYIYSPVPTEGSELYESITAAGFKFPEKLEDWLSPEWENFDLRKNPLTPWLTPEMVDKIKNFETVLHGYSPTISDHKLSAFQRKTIRKISTYRYKNNLYKYPYEIKVLQKFWLKYRQPEIEGFYAS